MNYIFVFIANTSVTIVLVPTKIFVHFQSERTIGVSE